MCVIVIYKLSVGHAKIFCDFFTSTTDFRQKSVEFCAKPVGIRWPNYHQIRPIIRLIWPNFVFPNFFCYFRTSTAFRPNFFDFNDFFKIFKMRRNRWEAIFHCPTNSVTLVPTPRDAPVPRWASIFLILFDCSFY
jgi:hypothetical protein